MPAIAEGVFQLLAQVGMVDDQAVEARGPQAVDLPDDEGLPPTLSRGLGVCRVRGRMRLPSPAARIMALQGKEAGCRIRMYSPR